MSSPASVTTARTTVRQTWIDQARWAAILLVVAGHALGQMRSESDLAVVLSNFFYMFHIPVLVLLAGWGARRIEATGGGLAKIWWQLLAPFMVFQVVAYGVNYAVKGTEPNWAFTTQTFGLWFLVALAGWRLVAPWFRGLRFGLPIAVGLALAAGLSDRIGGTFSLSRILVFLPLFLVGPMVVDRVSEWRTKPVMRIAAGAVLAAAAATCLILRREFWRTPFLGSRSYEALDVGWLEGMLWRALVLVVGLVVASAFMVALPGRPGAPSAVGSWVATAGQHTMYPYLLHLPLLTVVGATSARHLAAPTPNTAIYLGGALLLTVLSVTPPVRALLRPLVEPGTLLTRRPR